MDQINIHINIGRRRESYNVILANGKICNKGKRGKNTYNLKRTENEGQKEIPFLYSQSIYIIMDNYSWRYGSM